MRTFAWSPRRTCLPPIRWHLCRPTGRCRLQAPIHGRPCSNLNRRWSPMPSILRRHNLPCRTCTGTTCLLALPNSSSGGRTRRVSFHSCDVPRALRSVRRNSQRRDDEIVQAVCLGARESGTAKSHQLSSSARCSSVEAARASCCSQNARIHWALLHGSNSICSEAEALLVNWWSVRWLAVSHSKRAPFLVKNREVRARRQRGGSRNASAISSINCHLKLLLGLAVLRTRLTLRL